MHRDLTSAMVDKLKILMASPEVHPFAKTGGLADVSAALPRTLKAMGHDVRVIMPKYRMAGGRRRFKDLGLRVDVPVGKTVKKGSLYEAKLHKKIPIYFVANNEYFQRKHLYGENNKDYPDNAARFIFFCRSILEACKALKFQPDIIHCHDWQTGLVPVYLKSLYRDDPFFKDTRTLYTVHNMAFQGNFGRPDLELAHLPEELFNPDGVEFYGKFSFLKSGLVYADLLTTVSPTYCREVQTPEWGFLLDGVLRHRGGDFHGILNGVDYQEWDPARDPWIEKNYGPEKLGGKRACRKKLIQTFALDADESIPILSMVCRLSHQKGVDIVIDAMETMLQWQIRFVILGTGDSQYQEFFRELPKRYPGKCACRIGFDEKLAHQVLAGSDIFLAPSRFEPCGLTQLYAMKYGTVPLVRSVGGLADSVQEFDPNTDKGTGFKFFPFETKYFLKTLQKALSFYKDRNKWRRLMLNGMARDYSWNLAAEKYLGLYFKALTK